jgi:uncharacterized protein (DUF433 family)
MTPVTTSYIWLDDQGRAWIDDTNPKVIEVALDQVADAWTPEAIHIQYPHLSMTPIHAALAYYYDHKAEFDAEIERQDKEYEALRASQLENDPIRQKPRAADLLP